MSLRRIQKELRDYGRDFPPMGTSACPIDENKDLYKWQGMIMIPIESNSPYQGGTWKFH